MKELPPTFCYLPWTNVDISPRGSIRPCCRFLLEANRAATYTYRGKSDNPTVYTHTLEEYKQSKLVQDVKRDMLAGKKPKGCERCWVDERNGVPSKRILDRERHAVEFEDYDLESDEFLVISLALGSYCNLKCRICKPVSSSKWIKEWESYTGEKIEIQEFYKNPEMILDVIKHIDSVIHIEFPGGEPLLTGIQEQQKILRHLIQIGAAPRISLHYTTNATIFPDPQYWENWKEFKNVDIQQSIDDTGARFEFNRYPAKWNSVYPILKRYQEKERELGNIQQSIAYTLSVFTIFYLPEFYQWCLDEGFPTPWLGNLHTPEYYRLSVFPKETKQVVIDKLDSSPHEEVRGWARYLEEEDDSRYLEEFKEWTGRKDEYRGQSFKETFPEIYPLLFS